MIGGGLKLLQPTLYHPLLLLLDPSPSASITFWAAKHKDLSSTASDISEEGENIRAS